MMLFRRVHQRDTAQILALMQAASPAVSEADQQRYFSDLIEPSLQSFAGALQGASAQYLFALEDVAGGRLDAICALSPQGLLRPVSTFRINTLALARYESSDYAVKQSLSLSNDLLGHTFFSALLQRPGALDAAGAWQMYLGAMLFLAQFPERFSEHIATALRGKRRPDGSSPFWDGLGRHFVRRASFSRMDSDFSLERLGVAELMPKLPVYVDLLEEEARLALGALSPEDEALSGRLNQLGFRDSGHVGVVDGGAYLTSHRDDLLTASGKGSMLLSASACEPSPLGAMPLATICTTGLEDFRAVSTPAWIEADSIGLPAAAMRLLSLGERQQVRVCTPGTE